MKKIKFPTKKSIVSVTNDINAVIKTDKPHGYIFPGMTVYVHVPKEYGMSINYRGKISVVDSHSFRIWHDTSESLPFEKPKNPSNRMIEAFVSPISVDCTEEELETINAEEWDAQ